MKKFEGFEYVLENIETYSSAGRRYKNNLPWSADAVALREEWLRVGRCVRLLGDENAKESVMAIGHALMQLHDIHNTLESLRHGEVMSEVDLFEIKNLCQQVACVRQSAVALNMEDVLSVPDVQDVFRLLDPDSTGVVSFYVYDSYDSRLSEIRKQLKKLRMQADSDSSGELVGYVAQEQQIQAEVLHRLSDSLRDDAERLLLALSQMAYIDVLWAKARLACDWHLTMPLVSESKSALRGLYNPSLRHHKEQQGLRYQPVDVEIGPGVTLVTGTNMGGKTVLLKTLAVAQMMAQYGMWVPAESAQLVLVDDVVLCVGDEQNELRGLSSFAAEMTQISSLISQSRSQRLMVLIDEPARTTNPKEGRVLAEAIANVLQQRSSLTVITTHYSLGSVVSKRYRVRGFDETIGHVAVSVQTINQFMDYSLVLDTVAEPPQEAIRIASLLGCDKELLEMVACVNNNR
ncbi:MAG: hypothetical protein KBT04_05735 [Bacteroidales bacterium]|nr:hypothetical protein [Candidatus Colimorpha onthohippi]